MLFVFFSGQIQENNISQQDIFIEKQTFMAVNFSVISLNIN